MLSLLEAIFVDPLTARFALFYLPALFVLIGVAVVFKRPVTTGQPARRPGNSLSSRVAQFGNDLADRFAASGITPNQVTWIGLVLVVVQSALFVIHRNTFWFGLGLTLSYVADALDGLVARRQGTVSKFGGYLDAMVDRYQEIVTCFAVGFVTGYWVIIFFVITGSMLTSYVKARVAIETPVDNKGWPDLMTRHRRLWVMTFGLMGSFCIPWLLEVSLISLGVMSYYTAFQRHLRARSMLAAIDRSTPIPSA